MLKGGALGFEAASRQARRVVMVEKSRAVQEALKANRQVLGANHIDIVPMDALMYLKSSRETFDVIFLDPPYDSNLLEQVLPLIKTRLAENGYLYIETRHWPADFWLGCVTARQGRSGALRLVDARRTRSSVATDGRAASITI
ncbi:RsmD family RNA methyltransferase [Paludibacterium denitrificans]|uniref:RsmD family RNA methyltransferase n=1 Tax=Paludibacterium denitrificans TaxID=2675226 RepID=UPI002477FEF4|nr:RsmD family RNA methyltransferase [Paludibacterium denitrificans]